MSERLAATAWRCHHPRRGPRRGQRHGKARWTHAGGHATRTEPAGERPDPTPALLGVAVARDMPVRSASGSRRAAGNPAASTTHRGRRAAVEPHQRHRRGRLRLSLDRDQRWPCPVRRHQLPGLARGPGTARQQRLGGARRRAQSRVDRHQQGRPGDAGCRPDTFRYYDHAPIPASAATMSGRSPPRATARCGSAPRTAVCTDSPSTARSPGSCRATMIRAACPRRASDNLQSRRTARCGSAPRTASRAGPGMISIAASGRAEFARGQRSEHR